VHHLFRTISSIGMSMQLDPIRRHENSANAQQIRLDMRGTQALSHNKTHDALEQHLTSKVASIQSIIPHQFKIRDIITIQKLGCRFCT